MDYYKQGKIEQKMNQQKEIISYWSTPQIYSWIGSNNPDYQLIEAIICYNNHGIKSQRIAELYNNHLKLTKFSEKINSYVVEHIIETCNKYKCTFGIVGTFNKDKNNNWTYDITGIPDSYFEKHNKYFKLMKKNTNLRVLELENKVRELQESINLLKASHV